MHPRATATSIAAAYLHNEWQSCKKEHLPRLIAYNAARVKLIVESRAERHMVKSVFYAAAANVIDRRMRKLINQG